jgi:hypothetical protein
MVKGEHMNEEQRIPGPPPIPSVSVDVVTASQHAALGLRAELLQAREDALALREKVAEAKATKSRIAEIIAYTIAIVNGLGAIGAATAYAIAQIAQAYGQAAGHR